MRFLGLFSGDSPMDDTDWALINLITFKKSSHASLNNKTMQCNKFQHLHTAQHPPPTSVSNGVVNLCDTLLDGTMHSVLSEGMNCTVTPLVLPTDEILGGAEKAISMLPDETWDEVWQEAVRFLKISKKLRNSLSSAKSRLYTHAHARTLWCKLPYQQTMEMLQWSSTLHTTQRSWLYWMIQHVRNQLKTPHSPWNAILLSSPRSPHCLNMLLNNSDHMTCGHLNYTGSLRSTRKDPLRPIISTTSAPTYRLPNYLASLLGPHLGE